MKTTIDIPQNELREAMKYIHSKTIKETVVYALTDFNRRQRLIRLANKLGTFSNLITTEDLKKARLSR